MKSGGVSTGNPTGRTPAHTHIHCYTYTQGAKPETARRRGHLTDSDTRVTYTHILGARNVAGQHVHPLTPAPNHTQITNPSPIQHTRAAERGAPCLAGRMTTIQPRWRTRKRPPPRKGSRREHECAGADGGAELPVSQAPQEEDDDDPDKVEDEEASANEEEESEGEHERHFGYNPDREVNVRVEYQAAMQDHVFAY